MSSKICIECNILKELDEFYKDSHAKDGHRSICKICRKIQDKAKHLRNRDRDNARSRAYYQAHREVSIQKSKEWILANPEKHKQYGKITQQRHPEHGRRGSAKYRQTHPEYRDIWRKSNPDKIKMHGITRRAKENKSNGIITDKEWLDMLERFDYRCLDCGANGRKDVKLTLDHIIPISKGGPNLISNAQPLCKSCNSRKHTKTIDFRMAWD